MAKKCFLPKTELTLLDGEKYTFRQIPLTRKTLPILERAEKKGKLSEDVESLLQLIEIGLSYDQEPGLLDELMESGAFVLNPTTAEAKGVMDAVIAAILPKSVEAGAAGGDQRAGVGEGSVGSTGGAG